MEGTLRVDSEPGVGSRFHFTVRLGLPSTPGATLASLAPAALAGRRVLIAEANATSGRFLVELLASWRLRPTLVKSAAEAIEVLGEAYRAGDAYASALVESHGGFPILEALRANPAWGVEASMMLRTGEQAAARRCTELGVWRQLLRPVAAEALLEALVGAPPAPVAHLAAAPPRPDARPLDILLVEDNSVNEIIARRVLEKRGHTVSSAHNGREAVALVEQHAFDLALMDVQMPVMDGLEATLEIRTRERASAGHRHLRIVAMTANAMPGDRERCVAAGMDGYLTKPLVADELDQALDCAGA
jgi:CheY-like chemotaxis protein